MAVLCNGRLGPEPEESGRSQKRRRGEERMAGGEQGERGGAPAGEDERWVWSAAA